MTTSSRQHAEFDAETFVLTSFVEQIGALGYGLPAECDPDEITWVGKCRP
jgi:hypothetical protein